MTCAPSIRTHVRLSLSLSLSLSFIPPPFSIRHTRTNPPFPTSHTAGTMEMETFQLFHLALCSQQPFIASAAAIVVANRADNSTVDGDRLTRVEDIGGKATLHAVATLQL